MLSKGFAASKQAREKQEATKSKWTPNIIIKEVDGDVPLYLNGDKVEEPRVKLVHNISTVKSNGQRSFDELVCGMEENGKCRGHELAASGDKRISRDKPIGIFSAVDLRWHGKKQVGEYNGQPKYQFTPLSADIADPFDDTPPRKVKGYDSVERVPVSKVLKFSNQWIGTLGKRAEKEGKKCHACGGKIKIAGWKIGKKVVAEEVDGSEAVLECSGCDEPTPVTIFDYPLVVSRSGADKSTSYSFELDKEHDIPDWAKEYAPIDLEKAFSIAPTERYDFLLKISGGTQEKEVEDEEEDDDLEDKKVIKAKTGVKKLGGLKKVKKEETEDEDLPRLSFARCTARGPTVSLTKSSGLTSITSSTTYRGEGNTSPVS